MIGNDVVDLFDRDADHATYRPGFDERVFSAAERHSLETASEPERQRWRLWAAKEAAFKAARRCDTNTVFSPSAFRVELDLEGMRGIVDHFGSHYRVLFNESQRFIHAIATRGARGFDQIMTAVGRHDDSSQENESRVVRALAREYVARHLGVQPKELEIRRDARVPWFWLGGRRLNLCLSLSHSGGFVAFACCEGDYEVG